jgi:hypothetical protein
MYGFDFSNAESVRNYTDKLNADSNEYVNYHVTKMGFRPILAEVAKIIYPYLLNIIKSYPKE